MQNHTTAVGALTAHDLAVTTIQLGRATAMLTEESLRRLRPATADTATATATDANLAARFAAPAGAR